jgi:hypothetical protein
MIRWTGEIIVMRLCHCFGLSSAMLLGFVMCGTDNATAVPPYVSPDQVREKAKVIATGKVDSFGTRDEERHPSAEGEARNWPKQKDRMVLLQVTVDGIEKGSDLIRPGDVITIRCWRVIRSPWYPGHPEGWIETHGTGFIPSEGGSARFFLAGKSDEGWIPVFPGQGVVRIDDTKPLEFPMEPVEAPGEPKQKPEAPGEPKQEHGKAVGEFTDSWPYLVVCGVGVWLRVSWRFG